VSLSAAAALFGTLLVLSLAPGPTEVALVARSAAGGYSAGAAMVAGILLADALLIAAAFAGITAVPVFAGDASVVISLLGAVVLTYLGFGQLTRGADAPERGSADGHLSSVSAGLALTLADPKALLGYAALLPAFLDVVEASIADALAVLGLASAAICLAKSPYIAAGRRASASLLAPEARVVLHRLSGGALIAVAAALLAQAAIRSAT